MPKIKARIKAKPPVWPIWTIPGWNESIQLPICVRATEMDLEKSKRIGGGGGRESLWVVVWSSSALLHRMKKKIKHLSCTLVEHLWILILLKYACLFWLGVESDRLIAYYTVCIKHSVYIHICMYQTFNSIPFIVLKS